MRIRYVSVKLQPGSSITYPISVWFCCNKLYDILYEEEIADSSNIALCYVMSDLYPHVMPPMRNRPRTIISRACARVTRVCVVSYPAAPPIRDPHGCVVKHVVFPYVGGAAGHGTRYVCVSVTALAASAPVYIHNQRYSRVSLRRFLDFDSWILEKTFRFQKLWREKPILLLLLLLYTPTKVQR